MEREPLAGRILPTALTLFGEHGYHGTSMQRIADALGVTRAAFDYYDASEQDLVRALAEPLVAELEDLAARSQRERHDVDTVLAGYLDVVLAHGRILRFVANDAAVQADADGVTQGGSIDHRSRILAAAHAAIACAVPAG